MINNDFISASESFENFLSKERRHGKRDKALEMLQFCQSQIPYQQVNYGVEDLFKSDFKDAVEWFNAAEEEAEDDLKIEIQEHRRNIASKLLDSVQNYKNKMTIAEAENLVLNAQKLFPDLNQINETIAGLFLDKGKLNTDIGNYSGAIQNYKDAILLYPAIESIVSDKLNNLTNLFMKDAYFAAKEDELFLVVQSLKSIIELMPDLTNELDPYLIKLETRLKDQHSDRETKFAQDYIQKRKQDTIPDFSQILQLGMTYAEVKQIKGLPKHIDTMNEPRSQFELWTYSTDSTISRLYFENNMLVRIEK
jgi:tetratricopeptide (TPR) repeat protein